eukprot:5908941-Alexandrium_andersonii.AAC.1
MHRGIHWEEGRAESAPTLGGFSRDDWRASSSPPTDSHDRARVSGADLGERSRGGPQSHSGRAGHH